MESSIALSLWYRALEQPIGIAITCNDRRLIARHLYEARQLHGDPALYDLILFNPPAQDEVWLCRKDADER